MGKNNDISKIEYLVPNIGYFKSLSMFIKHGFSWGKEAGNFAFTFGDKIDVYQRVNTFYKKLELGKVRDSVLIVPEHLDQIILLDEEIYNSKRGAKSGKNFHCDAIFTVMQDVTIAVKAADCDIFIIYAKNKKSQEIKGLMHAGWRGVSHMLPKKCIQFLVEKCEVNADQILVGRLPSISKKYRTHTHFEGVNWKVEHWGAFMKKERELFHLDARGFALKQVLEAGVRKENIYSYELDTYVEAKKGNTFSQKLAHELSDKGLPHVNGRYIVAIRS
ncbi:MAG: hypothetical protein Fur003_1230 [Candidatus Dojkabacteria bacterium]